MLKVITVNAKTFVILVLNPISIIKSSVSNMIAPKREFRVRVLFVIDFSAHKRTTNVLR